MKIKERIQLLRKAMQKENIQACIVPTTDPHISEYTPSHWKTRKWLSGFNGSAATVVVTSDKAGLWTDSRYFIQAEEQLKDTGIDLFKMGLPGTPTTTEWITSTLKEGDTIGIEGEVFEASEAKQLSSTLKEYNLNLNTLFAPWDEIWVDRKPIPEAKAFVLPEEFSGKSITEKRNLLLDEIKKEKGNATVLASLDQIAWLFNLRGTDIRCNPLVVSYAMVSEKETVLFIDQNKLTTEVTDYLSEHQVVIADYSMFYKFIKSLSKEDKVVITPNKINYRLYTDLLEATTIIETSVHPVDYLKSMKNETEITGARNAMRKDGAALVKFLIWIEKALNSGETITEMDVARMLREYRSQQPLYFSESFATIAGYNEHGAIVHYEAKEDTNATIRPEGILLIDSGAQYFDGTTDITRTIALGNVTDEMKKDYTNILKGNIQLSRAKFPKGTVGMQLDMLARQFIWQEGQNYMHGTGHGVGSFLGVHEGPQSIRMNYNPAPLLPGMITSNEPGLYKAGKYGIRIENLLLTVPDRVTEFGEYYAFETLTLCPIDTTLIDKSLLSTEETVWLNAYHKKVYDEVSPLLTKEEQNWLKVKASAI